MALLLLSTTQILPSSRLTEPRGWLPERPADSLCALETAVLLLPTPMLLPELPQPLVKLLRPSPQALVFAALEKPQSAPQAEARWVLPELVPELLPGRPPDSLHALETAVLLLPTPILPSSRLTEPRELLPEWPQPLVKLLRLSPQALVFGALEKPPSARPAEARWLLPELVPELLPELPPESLHALETAVLLLPTQILRLFLLTEPRELLPEWPQPLVKLLRLSPQALVFGALEKPPSARPAEARWLLPELVPELLPELPPESLHALETAVFLLPTQILPSSRLTEPQELLPEWPQPLVKLLRLSPQALVFAALEKLQSALQAEARWVLPELVRLLRGVLPASP